MKIFLFLGLYWGVQSFTSSQWIPRRHSVQLFSTPEPLASEGDWSAFLDKDNTGLIYYFNMKTGESLWEPPTGTFPTVVLDSEMREQAETQRLEYVRLMRDKEKRKQGKKEGILSKFMEKSKDEDKKKIDESKLLEQQSGSVLAKESKEEANWFDALFQKTEEAPTKRESTETSLDNEADASLDKATNFLGKMFSVTAETSAPTTAKPDNGSVTGEKVSKLDMAAFVLPHPAKQLWGGEDATFTKGRTFGVFDGVSGAFKLDGVPLYSKTLASELKRNVADHGLTMKEMEKALLDAAVKADSGATGASTAIVASIDESGFLRVLNVGDSTCIVVRGDKIVTRSKEISHYFDCPYQLSSDSPDRPKDGTKMNIELLPGDLIVMGSDGVFDNLDDKLMIDTIQSSPSRTSTIAKRLSELSRKVSLNKKIPTPYAKAAQRNGDPDFVEGLGGKLDDVSCVVVRYE